MILLNIPDKIVKRIRNNMRRERCSTIYNDVVAIADARSVFDAIVESNPNPTNRDMIMSLYPDATIENISYGMIRITLSKGEDISKLECTKSWLDAPYKTESDS